MPRDQRRLRVRATDAPRTVRRPLRELHSQLHVDAAPTEVLEVVSGPFERPIALRGKP